MRYWQRQRFWWALLVVELMAFALSAGLATGLAAILMLCGMNAHHMAAVTEIAGPILNVYLAYSGFCYVRDRALRWPVREPQGFAVVIRAGPRI